MKRENQKTKKKVNGLLITALMASAIFAWGLTAKAQTVTAIRNSNATKCINQKSLQPTVYYNTAYADASEVCFLNTREDFETKNSGLAETNLVAKPNPLSNVMVIPFHSKSNAPYLVEIIDIKGNIILADSKTTVAGSNKYELNLNDVATGIYVVVIKTDEETLQTRITKN
jgi:hypothetical protein